VSASKNNVLYIKVPDVKVYSCSDHPTACTALGEAMGALRCGHLKLGCSLRHHLYNKDGPLSDYSFTVSIVEPWYNMPKHDPTNKHTTKSSFVYCIKVERLGAPPGILA
jgi:hypothetical protein